MMTPEERLDRLTERVDAIAHSLELLAGMQIETEKHMATLDKHMATLADGMALMTRVVLDHAHRIENLEGDQTQH
jgi:uncharacterized coiled-coil protein SlyX